jgi:hypothetical protein
MNDISFPQQNTKGLNAVTQANSITIDSNDSYSAADAFCVSLKELEKEVAATFKDPKDKAWAAHKAVVAAENKHLEPIEQARRIIKQKLDGWRRKMEDERRKEEDRLRLDAKKRAEDEALRIATSAHAMGNREEADTILAEPIAVETIVLPKFTPKTNTTFRTVWKFRIVNADLIPQEYLCVDEMKIGAVVRATKGAVTIPGVVNYSENV